MILSKNKGQILNRWRKIEKESRHVNEALIIEEKIKGYLC